MPLSEIHAIPVAAPKAVVRPSEPSSGPSPRPGYSRFPVTGSGRRSVVGYLHIKDVLPHINDPDAVLAATMVRPLPRDPGDDAAARRAVVDAAE